MHAFVRSVELGSFSRAANESGMKVSTVSRYVSALEADLGVALLNRSTRSLHLTEAGSVFYDRSSQILQDVQLARSAATAHNSHPRGLLRINIPGAFGRLHVMPYMQEFLATYPDVRLDATLTDTTVDLIDSGGDVAIRIGAMADSSLIARRLASQRRVLVAAPRYCDGLPLMQPEDLKTQQCLLFTLQPYSSWFCRPVREPAAKLTEVAVNGAFRANDSEALREATLTGLGLALLPTWLVGDDLRAGRLVQMLGAWEWHITPGVERAIFAVYPPKKIVSPKVRVFIEFLAQRYGQPAYWEERIDDARD